MEALSERLLSECGIVAALLFAGILATVAMWRADVKKLTSHNREDAKANREALERNTAMMAKTREAFMIWAAKNEAKQ